MHANSVSAVNEQLARQINQEARRNPHSPYAGKLVGIANGQVVVVGDSWRDVAQQLRQVEPDPAKCFCIDASADYDRREDIWRVH
ncbi:MAG TPA: hypothetical protein VE988_04790 [Gemmataceae bacterium]|nr:hypothetical protein [Gemmataceae bacterium]